jgi:hypothetical protein
MFNVKKMKKYLKYEINNLLDELFVCHAFMKLVYIKKEPNYLVLHTISMNPLIHSLSNLHKSKEKLITP